MDEKSLDPLIHGEVISPRVTFTWIDPKPIDAGEMLIPTRLTSPVAREFAALHLIHGDLAFALECLVEADKFGTPDSNNLLAKSLIFSGVVGYARCFKSGVRATQLNPTDLIASGASFDQSIHEYLIALRDKHVAHSVNDFEDCEAIAIVIGRPETPWRDGSAVGVTLKQTIGINAVILKGAINHIDLLCAHIKTDLERKRLEVYSDFKAAFERGETLEAAPILRVSDRANISKRRKSY